MMSLLRIAALSSFFALAFAASPPQEVELIFPAQSSIALNQQYSLGYADSNKTGITDLIGLSKNVSISLQFPNGTARNVLTSVGADDELCRPSTGFVKSDLLADATGQYVAVWNITYGISSDPSQANASYCGPPPFSYQSFLLNRTFEVQDQSTPYIETTATTELPTQPTGNLRTSDGTRSSAPVGMISLAIIAMLHLMLH